MRILHTSDWHLGHQLYGYDRSLEHKSMLRQIVDIVREYKPDVFILAGDIFHTGRPSAAVQKLFVDGILDLHKAHEEMAVIMTAGNHDSGVLHEVFRTPWKILGVDAVGTLRIEDPDYHIIEIPGKGYIIAVPYANERYIPKGFFSSLTDKVKSRNLQSLPVIMTAHTTVKGSLYDGHERTGDWNVGGIEGIELNDLGAGYDYLALGHIHHQQFVHSGRHNVRYSGSPVAVSFDEDYPHTVSIIDIEKHGERPSVEQIEIKNPIPLVSLPASGYGNWEQAIELLEDFPNQEKAYIRLNISQEKPLLPGAFEEAQAAIKEKACNLCQINFKKTENVGDKNERSFTLTEFQEEDPVSIARRYIASQGGEFDKEMVEMFQEVMDMVKEERRNIAGK